MSGPSRRILVIAGTTTYLAGVGMNVQVRMNAELVIGGGQPIGVALANMLIQLASVGVIALAWPAARASGTTLLRKLRRRQIPPWQLAGGVFGALMITSMGAVSPLLGVAVFAVCIVAGQTVSSLAVDRLGLGPAGRRDVTPRRLIAALTAVVAVVVSVWDRLVSGQVASTQAWALLLAVGAGAGLAIQAAANGQVARAAGSPMAGAGVNFVGGVVILSLLALATPQSPSERFLGSDPTAWWLYSGAFFGLVIVINGAWAVRYLGVLLLALLSVAGQLSGAVLADALVPAADVPLSGHLLAGAALALIAGVIGSTRRGSDLRPPERLPLA